jgi:hypothetical protein
MKLAKQQAGFQQNNMGDKSLAGIWQKSLLKNIPVISND